MTSEYDSPKGTFGLTSGKIDIEYEHALVLPWWGVFATASGRSSNVVKNDEVFAH
jgi:hypothetical protein